MLMNDTFMNLDEHNIQDRTRVRRPQREMRAPSRAKSQRAHLSNNSQIEPKSIIHDQSAERLRPHHGRGI